MAALELPCAIKASIGILRDGKLVYMMERRQIESRDAQAIAADLKVAFDQHCAAVVAN